MTEKPRSSKTVDPATRRRASALRRRTTEEEDRLWWHLRHRLPIEGTHFRRQVPIGSYIADFCCLRARLIIEVDGEQHGYEAVARHDIARTRYLEERGYRVLRFWNSEILREIEAVLDTIHAALLVSTPTPDPSPQGGGEQIEPDAQQFLACDSDSNLRTNKDN